MFRIHDIDELKRMIMIIGAHNNSTVKFPIDVFKDASEVAVIQYGSSKTAYSYTRNGHADFAVGEGEEHSRETWVKREKADQYVSDYRATLPMP